MAKKPTGITPNNLRALVERINSLPIVKLAVIPTKDTIIDNMAVFRDAIEKGYTRDQLVEMWNEHVAAIREGAFAGYPNENADNIREKAKPKKRKEHRRRKMPHWPM